MTPFIWAQTADSRPLVPALRLKPSCQHLTCCLEPLTSMMIASYCTSFHTANFQIRFAFMDCTILTLAYIPLNYMSLDCDEDVFFFSYSSDLYPVRQNKEDLTYSSSTTWIAYNSTAILTWQIIRSKGPILHYPHNKALPVGPTHVATKLEHCAMYSISLFHSFSLKSISDMGGSVSTSESYLTLISNKAFKYVHNV